LLSVDAPYTFLSRVFTVFCGRISGIESSSRTESSVPSRPGSGAEGVVVNSSPSR